jgi:hypothetical protein
LAITSDGALVRFGGRSDVPPWHYRSAGYLGRLSVDADGTAYVSEYVGDRSFIVIIDTATSLVKGRVAVRPSSAYSNCVDVPWDPSYSLGISGIYAHVVDAGGAFHALVHSSDTSTVGPLCTEGVSTRTGVQRIDALEISPDGQSTVTPVWSTPGQDSTAQYWNAVGLPDSRGGVLFAWWDDGHIVGSHVAGGSASLLQLPAFPLSAGDDGTAVGNDGINGLISYDMESTAVVHSYGRDGTVVAPLEGGGLVLYDGTLSVVDHAGTVTQASPIPPTAGYTGFGYNYWTLGQWLLTTSTGQVAMAAGPSIVESEAFFAPEQRGVPGRGGDLGPVPRIAHFVTLDALNLDTEPFYIAEDYEAAVKKLRGTSTVHIKDDASVKTFLTELGSDAAAVVFIGDSLKWHSPGDETAVGLVLREGSLIKLDRYDDTVDPRDAGQSSREHSTYRPQLATQARIVFIGACVIGDQFKAWWNVNDDTKDQALVVPQTVTPTGLTAAAHAWIEIQRRLMSGHVSLKRAVDDTNQISVVKFMVIGGSRGANIYLR